MGSDGVNQGVKDVEGALACYAHRQARDTRWLHVSGKVRELQVRDTVVTRKRGEREGWWLHTCYGGGYIMVVTWQWLHGGGG